LGTPGETRSKHLLRPAPPVWHLDAWTFWPHGTETLARFSTRRTAAGGPHTGLIEGGTSGARRLGRWKETINGSTKLQGEVIGEIEKESTSQLVNCSVRRSSPRSVLIEMNLLIVINQGGLFDTPNADAVCG